MGRWTPREFAASIGTRVHLAGFLLRPFPSAIPRSNLGAFQYHSLVFAAVYLDPSSFPVRWSYVCEI